MLFQQTTSSNADIDLALYEQIRSDETLEQLTGGDGTCSVCSVDYIAVNDEQGRFMSSVMFAAQALIIELSSTQSQLTLA